MCGLNLLWSVSTVSIALLAASWSRELPPAEPICTNRSGGADNRSFGKPAVYVPTLVDGITPSPFFWADREWRVNSGAVVTPGMAHAIRISPDRQKIRFELRNSDHDNARSDSTGVRRAELSGSKYGDPTRLPNGRTLWGAFSFNHHKWANPTAMQKRWGGVYGQIHIGSKFGGSPALAFRRGPDGAFRITTRGEFDTEGSLRYEQPLSFGTVHDLVYKVSLHPRNGRLTVWIDGRLAVDIANASIGHSNAESYWNFGVYFAGGISNPVIAEYANHVYPGPHDLSGRIKVPPCWPR